MACGVRRLRAALFDLSEKHARGDVATASGGGAREFARILTCAELYLIMKG